MQNHYLDKAKYNLLRIYQRIGEINLENLKRYFISLITYYIYTEEE